MRRRSRPARDPRGDLGPAAIDERERDDDETERARGTDR